ncbi:MAG: DUF4468 domain-containing protein [Cycloclasticus sp.]
MKVLLLSALVVLLAGCSGYDYTNVSPEQSEVGMVVDVPGADKDVLYDRAAVWIASTFVSANDVVQNKNKEAGRIMGRGVATIYITSGMTQVPYSYRYSIRIDVKDNKARIKFADYRDVQYRTEPKYGYLATPLIAKMNVLAADFELSMKAEKEATADAGW